MTARGEVRKSGLKSHFPPPMFGKKKKKKTRDIMYHSTQNKVLLMQVIFQTEFPFITVLFRVVALMLSFTDFVRC